MVDAHLEKAYTHLCIEEQVQLYERTINFAANIEADYILNVEPEEQQGQKEEK